MAKIRILKNGAEIFPAMFAAMDRAVSFIGLEMYIFADDATGRAFREHLVSAAKRGVRVMVMVDAVGSWSLPAEFWDELRNAGGMMRQFRPVWRGMFFLRNHRKLLLLDDRIAYIGGMNIADEYFQGSRGEPAWRDNAFEITGTEVTEIRRSFDRMWTRAEMPFRKLVLSLRRGRGKSEQPVSGDLLFLESGPEDPLQPVRKAYRQLIGGAERSIDLSMGYFYPHGRILRALKRAVLRGVRVRLLFTQRSDVAVARWAARGLYGRLLRDGMEVWEYRPAMMHAKLAIIDDVVVAGSANLDMRSGRINNELVAVVRNEQLARQALTDFEGDLGQADRISLKDWKERPLLQRFKERVSAWLLARLDIFIARAEMARMMR